MAWHSQDRHRFPASFPGLLSPVLNIRFFIRLLYSTWRSYKVRETQTTSVDGSESSFIVCVGICYIDAPIFFPLHPHLLSITTMTCRERERNTGASKQSKEEIRTAIGRRHKPHTIDSIASPSPHSLTSHQRLHQHPLQPTILGHDRRIRHERVHIRLRDLCQTDLRLSFARRQC